MARLVAHAIAATLAMAGLATAGLASPDGRPLYTPDRAAASKETAGYPRVIRLEHADAANGTLLATFAHAGVPGETGSLPIYRSTDGGRSWSTQPIGVVRDTVHGWDIEAPALFELPVAQGDLPSGTLFAAGTAWNRPDFRQQAMEVFVSRDGGATWNYRSSCASEALQVNNEGHGIWEPFFVVTKDGSLNCFFSDERPSADGFAQIIKHVRSTDGGATWGPEIDDVAVHDGLARPGMPTVVRLPDGRFAMSFENCQAGADADHYCSVYVKFSPDGQDWTPVSGLGVQVATADGKRLLHTPSIGWTPFGGSNGTIIVSGQRVVSGPDGHVTVEPESGRMLMTSSTLGAGPWKMVRAPLTVDPTGSYAPGASGCPGYSSPVLPAEGKRNEVLMLAGTALPGNRCEVRVGIGPIR